MLALAVFPGLGGCNGQRGTAPGLYIFCNMPLHTVCLTCQRLFAEFSLSTDVAVRVGVDMKSPWTQINHLP